MLTMIIERLTQPTQDEIESILCAALLRVAIGQTERVADLKRDLDAVREVLADTVQLNERQRQRIDRARTRRLDFVDSVRGTFGDEIANEALRQADH